ACLQLLLPARGVVHFGDHVLGHGREFFDAACAERLEGVVAKKRDSQYVGKRSRDWLKLKCQLRQEFVIGGYTAPQGSRAHFGALHLGLYRDGQLVYVSKVGTGFDEATLELVSERLRPLARATSPFDVGTPAGRGHHWVEPKLVCEVRFTEWTADGGIRHPTFLGLRDDKRPEDCRRELPSKDAGRDIDYFVVNDRESLRYVINLGTIPLHMWSSHLGSLDHPDWLVLDLDPKGAPFTDVVKVARALQRILDALALPSYVKTSGQTGLHIMLPLGAAYDYETTRTFARLLAVMGVEAEPAISTIVRPIKGRGGKVYIDWGQNGHGQTIVAPFSVRPLPGAPVSCPLRWEEVTARLDPTRFTIKTAPPRF